MKRLTWVLGMVLAAAIAYGQVVPVPSVNVVGYAKIPQPPGLDLKSAVFYVMSGTNTLGSVLGTTGVANANSELADNVYLYSGGEYKEFWLYDGSAGPEFDHQWVDGYQIATNEVLPGQGFWVRNRSTTTNYYSQLGEAVLDGEVSIVIQPGLQALAYPYSADVVLGDLSCVGGAANANSELADNIYLYVNGNYTGFWLYDGSAGPEFDHKWVDGYRVATNVIKAGQAFWYRSRNSTNIVWTETRPYLNE